MYMLFISYLCSCNLCLLQDLLVQLFKESPYTGGIFRKSANARHVKELKTKLDVGLDVSLDDVNVHVIGATFKVTSLDH